MTIKARDLRSAAKRFSQFTVNSSFESAAASKRQTAFMCHSHLDRELVKGFQMMLIEQGMDVYIDWEDNEMPEIPDRETASRIKNRIEDTDHFVFLATENSTQSRWCPWEIGLADTIKGQDGIFIIPVEDDSGRWYGNEYLRLYQNTISDIQ